MSALHEQIHDPGVRRFLDVWLGLFEDAGQRIPARRSIDPLGLRGLLSCVWLYERIEDGSFTCLLAGEEISAVWDRPMRLRRLSEIVPDGGHVLVAMRFSTVLDNELIAHGLNPTAGKEHSFAERLYAPIADASGEVRYVFGVSRYLSIKDDRVALYREIVRDAVVRCYDPKNLALRGEFQGGAFVETQEGSA